jgi:hypothetical protein
MIDAERLDCAAQWLGRQHVVVAVAQREASSARRLLQIAAHVHELRPGDNTVQWRVVRARRDQHQPPLRCGCDGLALERRSQPSDRDRHLVQPSSRRCLSLPRRRSLAAPNVVNVKEGVLRAEGQRKKRCFVTPPPLPM